MKIKLLFITAIMAVLLCQCSGNEKGPDTPVLPEGVDDIVGGASCSIS